MLEYIGDIFSQCTGPDPQHTLRAGKDMIRQHIGQQDPALGFAGSEGIDLYALGQKLLNTSESTLSKQYICRSCRHKSPATMWNMTMFLFDKFIWKNQVNKMGSYKDRLLNLWLKAYFTQKSEKNCPNCARPMIKQLAYTEPPKFISCVVYKLKIEVETQISIPGHQTLYRLCGIVYFALNHFVAKIVDKCGEVWYNDGFEMGEETEYIGNIINMISKDLLKHKKYSASLLVYTTIL